MRYIVCVGFPLLFQAAFSWIVIQAVTGGGSFVGLGAMLFALAGIPLTAIVNLIVVRNRRGDGGGALFVRTFLVGLLLPLAQLALLIVVAVFRL